MKKEKVRTKMMERVLNLVKNDFEQMEKRILPSFPFCYLFFKDEHRSQTFEVKDISFTGMQLRSKGEGLSEFKIGDQLKGEIHWQGQKLKVWGKLKWVTSDRLGVEFLNKNDLYVKIKNFLSDKNVASHIKALHQFKGDEGGLDLPPHLKYWFWADGPIEIFIWQHSDGEISKIQFLIFDTFLEWIDGKGLSSGKIISKRDLETPLIREDEWLFKMDLQMEVEKIRKARNLIAHLDESLISLELKSFILRQLK